MTGDLAINMWSNLFALYFNKQTVEEFKRESPYELVKKRQVFIRGWIGYFRAADMKRTMMSWDEWLRRRFRMYIWKQWKKPKMKVTNLRKLGAPGRQALPMWEFQTGLPAYCRKSGIEMFHYKRKTRGSWIL